MLDLCNLSGYNYGFRLHNFFDRIPALGYRRIPSHHRQQSCVYTCDLASGKSLSAKNYRNNHLCVTSPKEAKASTACVVVAAIFEDIFATKIVSVN